MRVLVKHHLMNQSLVLQAKEEFTAQSLLEILKNLNVVNSLPESDEWFDILSSGITIYNQKHFLTSLTPFNN